MYFTLFLISFIFISLARSLIPLKMGIDANSTIKLESVMLNFSMIFLTLFLYDFFKLQLRKIIIWCLGLIGFTGLAILIWPYPVYFRQITDFTYLMLIAITFFVLGSPLVISLIKRKKYAFIMTGIFLTGWFFLFYDALMQSSGLFLLDFEIKITVLPFYSAILGIFLSLILTHKYWNLFKGTTYDQLTGTLLKPAFFQRLSEEMLRSQRDDSSLLFAIIDIQQATKINANYNYNSVNQLLISVSESLKKSLRPFDLICRIGDEQFCIVASCRNPTDAEVCLKRLFDEIMKIKQFEIHDIALYLETKIGAAIYDKDIHLTASQLIKEANYALIKTKNMPNKNYLLFKNSTQIN